MIKVNIMGKVKALLLILVVGIGCTPLKKDYKEDFNLFYKRFYSDSNFQRSRVKFPLAQKDETPSGISSIHIPAERWSAIYTIPKDTIINGERYQKKLTVGKETVTQTVFIPNSGFQNICTFKRIKGKWMLVSISSTNL